MSAPIITIFVRHTPSCKYAGDEFTKLCRCRKHLRWSRNGKQFRKQAGTRSWAEAEDVKADLADQLAGRVTEKRATQGHDLRTSYDAFLKGKEVKEISDDSYAKYKREILRFITFCEGRKIFTLEGIDGTLLTDYKARWPELYPSTATRKLVQTLIRVFLNYCHAEGWLSRVPKMDAVKVDEPPTQPLTDEEYAAVLEAAKGRTRAIIQLMRWSGIAVRDASCLLSAELVKSSSGRYSVVTDRQKTGIHVSVPIPPDVAAEVLAAADKGKTRLFWNGNGKAENFSRDRGREISAAFEKASVETEGHMISHRLRDTFACHLLSNGVPMEEVSKLLGHTSIVTTERHYSAWATARQDRVDALVVGTWK